MLKVLRREDTHKNSDFRFKGNLSWLIIRVIYKTLVLAGFLHFCSFSVFAENLPFKIYTTADGLAQDNINKIVRDSRGFLWFCTGDGLSRFDGYNFKTYTQEQGLPHRYISDFLETKDGTYLVSTNNGISIFNPYGKAYRWNVVDGKLEQNSSELPIFQTFTPPEVPNNKISKAVFSLAQQDDDIFAGTNHGLFRFVKTEQEWKFEKIEFNDWKDKGIDFNALLADSKHGLWIAANSAVYWRSKDGTIEKVNEFGGNSIFEDRQGRVWVDSGGNDIGIRIYEFIEERPKLLMTLSKKDGLPVNIFSNAIAESDDGKIFVTSKGLLLEYLPDAKENEPKFLLLNGDLVNSGAIDKGGNFWFGTIGKGAFKASLNSFTSFGMETGISTDLISSIFINSEGEVFTLSGNNKINRLVDGKIESIIPFGLKSRNWGVTFLDFQSSDGEWWLPSTMGLLRYPKIENFNELARTPPKRIYTTKDGLFSDQVFNIFEDSRRDIWISATDNTNTLQRWDRKTDKIIPYTTADGIPSINGGATSFAEDSAGNVWISFFFGGLARFRDGQFQLFSAKDGIPEGNITDFLNDNQGRFWIATRSRGLFRVENPNADTPIFTNFSMTQGLLSNETNCLTKDKFGRIYVGTGRGLNRLEPETFNIKTYTQADGLAGNYVTQCRSDKNGVLWLATTNALTRFVPTLEKSSLPPPVFISGISVNGNPQKISELGETEVKNLDLASDQRQIQIDFFALGFSSGENLRYQYKLDGQDWSAASDERSVAFNLAPGDYHFAVRAVNSESVSSQNPATVSFSIAPPFWQTWWFLLLAFLFVGGAVFVLDRYRVSKTRQVENALDEAKRAGIIIRESEIRYRTLAETASDAIITIDSASKIVYINEAAENIFGYKSQELIGKLLISLMPERFRQYHNAGINRFLSEKTRSIEWNAVELQGLHKDGFEVPLELSFGEFEKNGEKFFTGIARDISERKKSEAALQKAREERIAELQRVRTRIATDLHDDIGSSLTQISVYSEVARQRERENGKAGEPLDMITNVANELVDTMSDIVWAINPKKDHLQDLTQRMRRFAANVLTAKDIDLEFDAPDSDHDIPLGANIRREVFLIFKETVNNIVKHSQATEAEIQFSTEHHQLTINFKDNGKGFVQNAKADDSAGNDWKRFRGGNGLLNMKKRADDLGGKYQIESEIGKGTTVVLHVPIQITDEK